MTDIDITFAWYQIQILKKISKICKTAHISVCFIKNSYGGKSIWERINPHDWLMDWLIDWLIYRQFYDHMTVVYSQETKALCPPASSTSRGWGRTVAPAGTEPWSPPHRSLRRPRKRRAGSRRYCPTPFPGADRNRKLRKRAEKRLLHELHEYKA